MQQRSAEACPPLEPRVHLRWIFTRRLPNHTLRQHPFGSRLPEDVLPALGFASRPYSRFAFIEDEEPLQAYRAGAVCRSTRAGRKSTDKQSIPRAWAVPQAVTSKLGQKHAQVKKLPGKRPKSGIVGGEARKPPKKI